MFPSQDQELFLGTAKQETTKKLKSQTKAICRISFCRYTFQMSQ